MALLTNPMTVDNDGQPEPDGGASWPRVGIDGAESGGGIEVNYYWG